MCYTAALDELYGLGFLHYQEMASALEKVGLDEVREVANRYFLNRPAVTVIVRPENPQPPAELTRVED